jgi:uncharacterized membrane protein
MQMFWAFVFVMLVWLAHLVIQAGLILKLVNLLGFILMVAAGVWLLRRVLSRRSRFARHGQ